MNSCFYLTINIVYISTNRDNSKMKMKTAYSVVVFVTTFFVAVVICNLTGFNLFNSEINEENRVKVYSFLKKDKQILQEMNKAMKENDAKIETKISKWEIIQAYYKVRAKQSVSDLPSDFRYAWERKTFQILEWMEFTNYLREKKSKAVIESQAEKKIAEEKISEGKRLQENLISVAQKYGIKFEENYEFVE